VSLVVFHFVSFAGSNSRSRKNAEKIISPDSTECYAGKQGTVCGKVYGYYFNSKISGSPTFLDMGACYPHSTFTVLIGDSTTIKFNYDLQYLVNNDVCFTGTITVYNDKPEMIITDPEQITMDNIRPRAKKDEYVSN
jgi:hypothetical protein